MQKTPLTFPPASLSSGPADPANPAGNKAAADKPEAEAAQPVSPKPAAPKPPAPKSVEIGGPSGLEPTRYGDWERNGRVSDF